MKIFNRTSIYAMSMDRSRALKRIDGFSEVLPEHIIKCVVYGNTTNDLHHWVCHEICGYLGIVNEITVRPNDKKLKASDYASSLFGFMGDAWNDAYVALGTYALENERSKQYPAFEVTDELVDRVFFAFQSIITDTVPIFTTKNNMKREDFIPIVCRALQLNIADVM